MLNQTEQEAFLVATRMVYGDQDLPDEIMRAFVAGWHSALAWVTAEALKAERMGAYVVLKRGGDS